MMKQLQIPIEDNLMKELKMKAAESNQTLKEYVTSALKESLK